MRENCWHPLRPDWDSKMIDAALLLFSLCTGAFIWHWLMKPTRHMQVMLPGRPAQTRHDGVGLPWHANPLPDDATHIAWIMHGSGEIGEVHALYMQSIGSLRSEILESNNAFGPIIVRSIELECDIRSRGCEPNGELQYAIARIQSDGNETWVGRNGWVARWSKDAMVWDVFGFLRDP